MTDTMEQGDAKPADAATLRPWWTLAGQWQRWIALIYPGMVALLLTGLALRMTIKDSFAPIAGFYYATPITVLMGLALLLLIHDLICRASWRTTLWFGLAILFAIQWASQEWRRPLAHAAAEDSATDDLQVLFWNVARRDDLTLAAKYIRDADPDIVGLVEAFGPIQEYRDFWKSQLPEYDFSILGGGLQLLTKGTSDKSHLEKLDNRSIARRVRVTVRGVDYECYVVDIYSSPIYPREEPLRRLAELAAQHQDDNLIIMGDFNTPPDSLHLRPLRKKHQLLFEAAGTGYAPTWPLPLPVLQLDQIWINDRLQPVDCRHGMSPASDHRPVIGTVRARSPEAAPPVAGE